VGKVGWFIDSVKHQRCLPASQIFKQDAEKRSMKLQMLVKAEGKRITNSAMQRSKRSLEIAEKKERANEMNGKRRRLKRIASKNDASSSSKNVTKRKRNKRILCSDSEDENDGEMDGFIVDEVEEEEGEDYKCGKNKNSIDLLDDDEGIPQIESETEESDEEDYEDSRDNVDHAALVKAIISKCTNFGEQIKEATKETFPLHGEDLEKLGPFTLKPFQVKGVRWLYRLFQLNLNGVLADEMGLGKTIQTIGLLRLVHKYHSRGGPSLVVAPTSVLDNWMREFERITPELRVAKYHGSQASRMELQEYLIDEQRIPRFDILVTSYSIFEKESSRFDRKWIRKRKFRFMVLDEGHNVKNRKGRRFEALKAVGASHKLILSGTPIQNNIQELLALLTFLMPHIFDNQLVLEELAHNQDHDASIEVFRQLFEPFCLRRVKTHVLKEMSPKKDMTVKIPMDSKQRLVYQEVIDQHRKNYKRRQTHIFTEMRKAANHPLLLRKHYKDNLIDEIAKLVIQSPEMSIECRDPQEKAKEMLKGMSDFQIHNMCLQEGEHVAKLNEYLLTSERFLVNLTQSAKFDFLKEKLPELIKEDHRILMFSQWTSLLDILELLMQELRLKYLRLDGSTPASERQELVDTYNNDDSYKLFLLSTKSGGVGLNLTSADTVILHDLDFNPQNDLQAENRCHRIGQKKEVTVIRLVAKNTVDEHIFQIASKKQKLNEAVLAPQEDSEKTLTRSLLEDIFTKTKSSSNKATSSTDKPGVIEILSSQ